MTVQTERYKVKKIVNSQRTQARIHSTVAWIFLVISLIEWIPERWPLPTEWNILITWPTFFMMTLKPMITTLTQKTPLQGCSYHDNRGLVISMVTDGHWWSFPQQRHWPSHRSDHLCNVFSGRQLGYLRGNETRQCNGMGAWDNGEMGSSW